MKAEWKDFLFRFLLATAGTGSPRTVYHDRIDGLLFPTLETPERRRWAASFRKGD